MKQLNLSPFSTEEFLLSAADWQGDGILLESSALDSAAACDRSREFIQAGIPVIIRDLAAPVTVRSIPEDSMKQQANFQRFLQERCKMISALGIGEFSLSFNLERAAENAVFCHALRRFLGGLWGITEQYRLRLLLTAHLPSESSADAVWLAQFRQDLLYPHVGFLLELDGIEEVPSALKFYADRLLIHNDSSADLLA